MQSGENYELDLFPRQKTFTLEDVEIETTLELNVTFIDKQADLSKAEQWLLFNRGDIGVDIETTGLDPYQADIIMLQFGDKHRQFVVDTRKVMVESIIPLIVNKENTVIGQNLKFEYKFFKHHYKVNLEKTRDTMIQEICLYNGYQNSNSLKALAERYLDFKADKSIRERFLTIGDKPFNKDEIIYGAYDVILPMLIDEIQSKKLKERNQGKLHVLEHEYIKVLGDMEYKGLHFDRNRWYVVYLGNKSKYELQLEKLDEYLYNLNMPEYHNTQKDLFGKVPRKVIIQWSSSKQVIALFQKLGICPQAVSKTTKKMAYTVDAKVLKTSLKTTNKNASDENKEFIKLYLKTKELEQRVTTFGEKFFKYINPVTKRLHSNYRQIVSTGRSSSSAPNLQNIPADAEFRECFRAPTDYVIVNADFSGQENIVLANKSLDKDILAFYKLGSSDMHSFIASKIYNIPYEDFIEAVTAKDNEDVLTIAQIELLAKRGIAKAAGFAINYGGNGTTIANNLGVSQQEGEDVYNAYFKAFPGLRKYFDSVIKSTLDRGYVHINDVTNRRLNLFLYKQMKSYEKIPSKKSAYLRLKGKIERLSLNAPVQGTAADITKNAAVRFRKWIIENDYTDKVFITNIIHDEINLEAHKDVADIAAVNLEKCMAAAGDIWCKTVPLKAKAAIGEYWAH